MRYQTYNAVICTTLATEGERLVILDALVNHAVGEHGLVGDAEDENAEGEVLRWLGISPHCYQ